MCIRDRLKAGDTVMGMNLDHGGHLTHGSPVNFSGLYFNIVPYGVNDEGYIDYDELERIAKEAKPKLIVAGASAYARTIDFKRFREIADQVGAYLMVDKMCIRDSIHDPRLLPDMEKAVGILRGKLREGKPIRIVGDYDIDGVCSTYLLYRALKRVGANVDFEIPDRIKDGYGINEMIIEAAAGDGIDTILTVSYTHLSAILLKSAFFA